MVWFWPCMQMCSSKANMERTHISQAQMVLEYAHNSLLVLQALESI